MLLLATCVMLLSVGILCMVCYVHCKRRRAEQRWLASGWAEEETARLRAVGLAWEPVAGRVRPRVGAVGMAAGENSMAQARELQR